jgi:hypothetical protein
MKRTISHQLPNFLPDYPVKILLLGTFNPECGAPVKIHYGRPRNQTWDLLGRILNENFDPTSDSIHEKVKQHGIACLDIIQSVEVEDNAVQNICGNGYADSKLFANSVQRKYVNLEELNAFIDKNEGICVFSTWGKGSSFKKETWDFVCKIKNLHPLDSPSLVTRVNKETIFNNWKACIEECISGKHS